MAYNSLHKGTYLIPVKDDIFADELILKLSKKYDKKPAQIILNWAMAQDIIVIPKSSNIERAKENLSSLSFKLEDNDVKDVSQLNKNLRYCTGFSFMGGLDCFA
jgi:D-xylose reductase